MILDFFHDCQHFSQLVRDKTGKPPLTGIDVLFISRMINDELQELHHAKDETEEVDAVLDVVYYILEHCARSSVTEQQIREIVPSETGQTSTTSLTSTSTSSIHTDRSLDSFMCATMIDCALTGLRESSNSPLDMLISLVCELLYLLERAGLDARPIWKLIHEANLTKFGPGGCMVDGKWCKPKDFVPPDQQIRLEIARQRNQH